MKGLRKKKKEVALNKLLEEVWLSRTQLASLLLSAWKNIVVSSDRMNQLSWLHFEAFSPNSLCKTMKLPSITPMLKGAQILHFLYYLILFLLNILQKVYNKYQPHSNVCCWISYNINSYYISLRLLKGSEHTTIYNFSDIEDFSWTFVAYVGCVFPFKNLKLFWQTYRSVSRLVFFLS